jgi:hypothetical protein
MIRRTRRRCMCIGIALWLSTPAVMTNAAAQTESQNTDRPTLQSLAGDYQAGPTTITVTLLKDGTLTLFLPGQQSYRLDPQGGLRYRIRELAPGYGIDFLSDARGAITGITVHQPPPQRDFSASRKSDQVNARGGTTPAASAPTDVAGLNPPPASSSVQVKPVAPPPPPPRAPAATTGTTVQPTSAAPPTAQGAGPKRVTLVEGLSFEFPANWDANEAHTPAYPTQPPQTVGLRATSSDGLVFFEFRQESAGVADLSQLRRPANERARLGPSGPILDFELPGAKAMFARNVLGPGVTIYFFWVDPPPQVVRPAIFGRIWKFNCTEFSPAADGLCASVMRTFQVRQATATQPPPTSSANGSTGPAAALPRLPVKEPPASTRAPAALIERLSSDARVALLAPDQRSYAVKEAAAFYDYCDTNIVWGNFYACDCMAQSMLQGRLQAGFETAPTQSDAEARARGITAIQLQLKTPTDVILLEMKPGHIDTRQCIAPEKIVKYGAAWAQRMPPRETGERKQRITECVGQSLAQAYQAKPGADIGYIGNLESEALNVCIQRFSK